MNILSWIKQKIRFHREKNLTEKQKIFLYLNRNEFDFVFDIETSMAFSHLKEKNSLWSFQYYIIKFPFSDKIYYWRNCRIFAEIYLDGEAWVYYHGR